MSNREIKLKFTSKPQYVRVTESREQMKFSLPNGAIFSILKGDDPSFHMDNIPASLGGRREIGITQDGEDGEWVVLNRFKAKEIPALIKAVGQLPNQMEFLDFMSKVYDIEETLASADWGSAE